jgi:hypothetical protein
MKHRKHRSHSEWLSLIQQYKSSGCTTAEFCQKHSLNYKYFLKRKRSLESEASVFIKVQTDTTRQVMSSTALVLQYQHTRLHLTTEIDTQWLAQLMRSLP